MLETWSLWLAEPAQARDVLLDHARQHEERLALYERFEREMRDHEADELLDPRSPSFATYVALQRGLGFERGYAAWCRWAAGRVEQGGIGSAADDGEAGA